MKTRAVAGACLAVWFSAAAAADVFRLVLTPEATAIRFRLRATLHTVEGSATLQRGAVAFDPRTGSASGEIVVDARSLETGNRRRDRVMHATVLESDAFPTIVFAPDRFEGSLRDGGTSQVRLHGELRIHGVAHPTVIPAEVRTDGESLTAAARFSVPYVDLGMRDPSKLVLRVAKEVEIEIRLTAPLGATLAASSIGN